MIELYYEVLFGLSVLFTIIYIAMWHKRFDITFSMVFTLVPIACLGYVWFAASQSLQEALLSLKIVYISGCFLPFFIMLSVWNLCKLQVKKWLKTAFALGTFSMYGVVLTMGSGTAFYKHVSYMNENGAARLQKEYGFMHSVFYFMIMLYFVISIVSIIYSYFQKKQVSRQILFLLFLPDAVSMLCYFLGRLITDQVDFIPVGYVFAQLIYLIIAYRVNMYNINDTVIDSMIQHGDTGFISFDFKKRYLGSNETAKRILPALRELTVDQMIGKMETKSVEEGNHTLDRIEEQEDLEHSAPRSAEKQEAMMEKKLLHWLDTFSKNEENHEYIYVYHPGDKASADEERIYNVDISYLYDGEKKRGYKITLTDDTQNRRFIEFLDNYNERLKEEVEEKTKNIIKMHDNLIMGLATMVESRDNSTGGHIKRTSEGVRILMEEIRKDGSMELSDDFYRNIIKAAPMHDLGKIAVDDAILRKPGRFTDEEFEKMKHHAAEGARVIHEILKQTDDEAFKLLAENVAHYHHERWDGSGYPEGLKGEEIPLEARIMAIADVYDALVSKRVYKDSMSFEQADAIIMEGMGKHFDENLKKYYLRAKPRLEEYYKSLETPNEKPEEA